MRIGWILGFQLRKTEGSCPTEHKLLYFFAGECILKSFSHNTPHIIFNELVYIFPAIEGQCRTGWQHKFWIKRLNLDKYRCLLLMLQWSNYKEHPLEHICWEIQRNITSSLTLTLSSLLGLIHKSQIKTTGFKSRKIFVYRKLKSCHLHCQFEVR